MSQLTDKMEMTDGANMALGCAFCGGNVNPKKEHNCIRKRRAESRLRGETTWKWARTEIKRLTRLS